MTTTHTPGPWFVTRENAGSAGCTVWSHRGKNPVVVAHCGSKALALPGRQADARLISAAPDLLEALQAICDQSDRWRDEHGVPRASAVDPLYDAARAAIAKAGGAPC